MFNSNEKTISQPKLYEGGRYWLGAGLSFVEFPRMQMVYVWSNNYNNDKKFGDEPNLVTVNKKDITARSMDGLKITLDVSIHYKVGT